MQTLEQYQFSDKIFIKRYLKQFFIMLLTNLSTLILLTVDGLVVGRFVGEDALNSVNLLNPFTLVCGALTLLVASGVNFVLSKTYGIGSEEKKILPLSVASVSAFVLLIVLFPQVLFRIYGISDYSDFQLISVRFYMLKYVTFAVVSNLSTICVYCGKKKVTIAVSVLEVLLIVPAFFLLESLNHNFIFLCYFLCGLVSVCILSVMFIKSIRNKVSKSKDCSGIRFSFRGSESNVISEKLYHYLQDTGASGKDSYRLALVCEELGAYAEKDGNADKLHVFLAVKVFEKYIHVFYLDDSEPAVLNKKLKATNLILGNYNLLESMAYEFTYQNVSGYNNFIMKFER